MSRIIDFYDDSTGVVLREIFSEIGVDGVPDFVRQKSASLIPSAAIRDEKTLFAWPQGRRFSLDTPEDTYFSAKYFEKTAHLVPFQHHEGIRESLKVAAQMHGLDPELLAVKEASEAPMTDDDFLLVATVSAAFTKQASLSEGAVTDNGDGTVTLRLYPVKTSEGVKIASKYFPRGLSGELAPYRRKVATRLADLCAEHGVELSQEVLDETKPIKRSHLLNHIQSRIGLILGHNQQAARTQSLLKEAAMSQRGLPYEVKELTPIDPRLISGYQELMKLAYDVDLDSKFWSLFDRLDKAAGFNVRTDVLPIASLGREIEDDLMVRTCKLAGTIVNLPELMAKVSAEVWKDLAPDVLGCLDNTSKVARVVGELPETTQKILLTKLRGF